IPGRRNFMHSQCVASPIAPTMRKHSCSSGLLTARASIIGVIPSTQLTLFSLKMLIMLMSMKSTPSFCPATPLSFIACNTALVNLLTCWVEAAPTAPFIAPKERGTLTFLEHRELRPEPKKTAPSPHKVTVALSPADARGTTGYGSFQ